jgi:DNA-binding GntR family transcriptional regulator
MPLAPLTGLSDSFVFNIQICMTPLLPLHRGPLRDRIYSILRERIVRGELAPGATVRDVQIAESLGASRTPVREALVRLTSEEMLVNLAGRGFRVPPLVRREVREVQPLLQTLECLALETSQTSTPAQADTLAALVRSMQQCADDPRTRHDLDVRWHRCLIERCENQRLHKNVEELRDVLRRYELAHLAGVDDMRHSIAEHRAITTAYVAGQRAQAIILLREHWQRGHDELLALLPEETES